MRAIILAAGRGSRLPNYLSRNPKCFIKLRKKSLIDYQIESFNKMGISHLSIVTGYKKNLFKKFKLKTFFNKNWKKTNKYSNIQGQYMGVIKFRPKGWIYFKKILYEKFDKKSKNMYLTDVFQKIIASNKVLIYGVKYNSKWMEIDNFNDFKILKKNF